MPGSVEIGPVSVGVSIGPAISMGRGGFGSVIEGPVRGSLEGFRPMNITDIKPADKGGTAAPLGEIVFNASPALPPQDGEGLGAPIWKVPEPATVPSGVLQAEQIAAVAWKNTEAKVAGPVPEWAVLPDVRPDLKTGIDLQGTVLPDLSQKIGTHPQLSPSTTIQTEAVYAPAVEQQLVEEVAGEEAIKTEDRTDEPSAVREEEESTELRLKYVEDEPVSRQRRYELREAIKKARAEAQADGSEEIEGWRIKKYFVSEHGGNRSGIAQPGTPDGSLVETYQVLSAGNYESEREANEAVDTTVTEKKPVKKAKEGKKVKEIDIARVRRDPFLKRHPVEEVVGRVVKKKILAEKLGQKPVVIHEVQAESLEGTIEDNPDLAEVFQKAA